MMEILLMGYNYRLKYLVMMNGGVYVYKYDKCKFDQPFLSFQAKHIFCGKSKVCRMTEFSEALDNTLFDGNTLLLERKVSKNIYISGLEVLEFRTDDKTLDYISLMGNNMISYTFAIGKKYTSSLSTHYKYLKNDKIEERLLLNLLNDSLNSCEYHLSKNGLGCFKKLLGCNRIHSSWPDIHYGDMEEIVAVEDDVDEVDDEDVNTHELEYTNGSNRVVKMFN